MHRRPLLGDGGHHVEVEGFAGGAGILAAIEHGDRPRAGRQRLHQHPGRQGAEQTHLEQPHPFAVTVEPFHRVGSRLAGRAHQHHHPLSIGGPQNLVGPIGAAAEGGEALHGLQHLAGGVVVDAVHRFPRLEVHVRVLGGAADHRPVGAEGPGAVGADLLGRDQLLEQGVADRLQLLDLMGGAEAVEAVQHRQAAAQAGQGCDGGEVGRLLH